MEINWKMFIAPLLILFVFIGGIIGIINWQRSAQKEPTLTVNLPEGTTTTTEKEVIVSGKADSGDKVWVNGEETKVGDDGSYSKSVTLKEGDNKVEVKAESQSKKTVTTERTVKYNAPAPVAAPVTPEKPNAPAVQTAPTLSTPKSSAPTASTPPSNLSTSGPEEIIIPVVGAGGIVLVMVYYFKSRKQFASSIRKH